MGTHQVDALPRPNSRGGDHASASEHDYASDCSTSSYVRGDAYDVLEINAPLVFSTEKVRHWTGSQTPVNE
eukprot:2975379-Pyramimonas_sp.AAC.1